MVIRIRVTFSINQNKRVLFAANSDWLIVLFASIVIGQSNQFGCRFYSLHSWRFLARARALPNTTASYAPLRVLRPLYREEFHRMMRPVDKRAVVSEHHAVYFSREKLSVSIANYFPGFQLSAIAG